MSDRQADEVESLRLIYADLYTDVTPAGAVWSKAASPHFQITLESHENPARPVVLFVLDIQFTPTYPALLPVVKVLNPKNLLRACLAQAEAKIAEILRANVGEEVCFVLIMDMKEWLDDVQQRTEEVLSLEQERQKRLQAETAALESRQKELLSREAKDKLQQAREANRQIDAIRADYDSSLHDALPAGAEAFFPDSGTPQNDADDTDQPDPSVSDPLPPHTFVFDNVLVGDVPFGGRVRFRAVCGATPPTQTDVLLPVAHQAVVTPFLAGAHDKRAAVQYLLTTVSLCGAYWRSLAGRDQIRGLELELEAARALLLAGIVRVYGFQIDNDIKVVEDSRNESKKGPGPTKNASPQPDTLGWCIRILTEYSADLRPLADFSAAPPPWAKARSWLIQILPSLEYLHALGLTHRLLGPHSITITGAHAKLVHPSYAYTLLSMVHHGDPDPLAFVGRLILWRDPDPHSSPVKTDIWQLGVTFVLVMLPGQYHSLDEFLAASSSDEHFTRVHDLLSRMLQPKLARRATLLELNAVKFFRSGIEASSDGSPAPELLSLGGQGHLNITERSYLDFGEPKKTQNPSRYAREFEEVGKLGKGGFGEVVKARLKMEGTFYAIKKIKHRQNRLESLLSEVFSLARLNHQYIVRYYGCWVEENPGSAQVLDSESDTETDSDSEYMLPSRQSFQVDYLNSVDDFDNRIVFEKSLGSEASFDSIPESESGSSDEGSESDSDDDSSDDEPVRPHNQVLTPNKGNRMILYIQMEFCENNTLADLIERGLLTNEHWRLLRQILEAVSYIHSLGFIHRDLKPTNIFIDKTNNVKVGDFGLAKTSLFLLVLTKNNQVAQDLSTAVGTFFYTAKEVASGLYDEKVDMYSIGIIFFEMCYRLGTGMERAATLNDLRLPEIKFPADFTLKTEHKLVKLLLNHDPKSRPSAAKLLQSGLLPVEHQDAVIREALKSLADPALPWQQQVRQTLFEQPYLLARDIMFDKTQAESADVMLNLIIDDVGRVFRRHGAVQDFGAVLLPKPPLAGPAYELLDQSGAVLTLAYDLVVPSARFVARHAVQQRKTFSHGLVYRPNPRGIGRPEQYSAMLFHVIGSAVQDTAECLKTADEVLHFECFASKNAQLVLLLNHMDVLDSVVDYAFGMQPPNRAEILSALSQLGVERTPEETKAVLRTFKIQHTVVTDLVDIFGFQTDFDRALHKLRRIMVDLPLLARMERAMAEVAGVMAAAQQFLVSTQILFAPLSNYNPSYYRGALMFQALHRVDKGRKYARVATGGRYDALVASFGGQVGISGLQLSVTLLHHLVRTKKSNRSGSGARPSRCQVLFLSTQHSLVESAIRLQAQLWARDVSCDWYTATLHEDMLARASADGAVWLVHLRQPVLKKSRKGYKPIRVRHVPLSREVDAEYSEVLDVVLEKNEPEQVHIPELEESGPLFTVDIDQRVVVVPNLAKGKKRRGWELENDSKLAAAAMMKELAKAPIFVVDSNDSVLDMISLTSLQVLQDEWVKRAFSTYNKLPRNYAVGIYEALKKEAERGARWAVIHAPKTDKVSVVDLQL